jgi:hypothetical protein
MKLAIFLFLLSTTLYAYPTPEELRNAKITVKTRDGKTYAFSANKHKVVTRGAVKPSKKLNRFSLLTGIGPSHKLHITNGDTYKKFAVKKELLFGANYTRLLSDDFSAGVTVISNESFLLNVGLDF